MFGFKIVNKKEYNKLKRINSEIKIRNKELFIQTKDQEKEIELLKQKIEHLNPREIEKEVKPIKKEPSIKSDDQKEEFILKQMEQVLKPLTKINEISKKISDRDLEIIKYLSNGKHSITDMSNVWNLKNTAMTVTLHRIRKKLTHFDIELKEEILLDNTKKFYVDRNEIRSLFHY